MTKECNCDVPWPIAIFAAIGIVGSLVVGLFIIYETGVSIFNDAVNERIVDYTNSHLASNSTIVKYCYIEHYVERNNGSLVKESEWPGRCA